MKTPLPWFLLTGLLIFGVDQLNQERSNNAITITRGDIQSTRDQWQAQTGKPVSNETLGSLLAELVEQRRLAREAAALGLDRQDVIVERRLAQKMRFLSEGLSDEFGVSEPELERYFAKHRDTYQRPALWSLRHIFFSTEGRGEAAETNAEQQLRRLREKKSGDENWQTQGDAFMPGQHLLAHSTQDLEQSFGAGFVSRLDPRAASQWQGPLRSAFGYHLVWIERHEPARQARLTEVRAEVDYDYRFEKRRLAYDRYLSTLADKYPVTLEAGLQAEFDSDFLAGTKH